MKHLRSLGLLLILLFPVSALAGPVVYPVKEVIGYDQPGLHEKASVFAKWVNEKGLPSLSEEFTKKFQQAFGTVAVADIDSSNKHRVLVASLHLVRASQYSIPKMGTTEYHFPITLSIVFTNPVTSEVVYSFTKTSYAVVSLGGNESVESPQCLSATQENYDSLLKLLIDDASKNYNPAQIEARVAKIWNGLFILDQGMTAGIARGDELTEGNNIIKVIYASEAYSVAEPFIVGEIKEGHSFSKYANLSLANQFKKPKVLSFASNTDDILKAVSGFFESELSKESAFTLLPVNPGMQKILTAVARDTNAGQYEITNSRALPDFFIRFQKVAPRMNEFSAAGKAIGVLTYEQYVLGELLDRKGRIIYSALGYNEIKDENIGGIVFGVDARREILLKNTVVDLADKFAKSVRYARVSAPVEEVTGSSTLKLSDVSGQIRAGQSVLVFRNIGSVDGIIGEVQVPIWDAEVKMVETGFVTAETSLPIAGQADGGIAVKNGDSVVIESMSSDAKSNNGVNVAYCEDRSSKIGDIDFEDFSVLSNAYGYLLQYPLYSKNRAFYEEAQTIVKQSGFKDGLKFSQVSTEDQCLLPIYKVVVNEKLCEDGYCNAEVALSVGYRLFKGEDKKSTAAQTILKLKQVNEQSFGTYVQSEVSRNALLILKDKIQQIRY